VMMADLTTNVSLIFSVYYVSSVSCVVLGKWFGRHRSHSRVYGFMVVGSE